MMIELNEKQLEEQNKNSKQQQEKYVTKSKVWPIYFYSHLSSVGLGIADYNGRVAQDEVAGGGQESQCPGNGMAGEDAFHNLQKEVKALNEQLAGQKEQLDKILKIISGFKEPVCGTINASIAYETHVDTALPQHTGSRVVGTPVLQQMTNDHNCDGLTASVCFYQDLHPENSAQGQSGQQNPSSCV